MDALLLGPFELRYRDSLIDLGDLQQRYTLAALLLHANRPISSERLVEIVWARQPKPRTNLIPGYIAKLRKSFRDAGVPESELAIDTTPTGYVLRIARTDIDAVRFEQWCAAAIEAKQRGDTKEQAVLLRKAVGLWRGGYLEDLDIDRVGAADVISPVEPFFDALGDLAELELAEGRHRWVRDRLRPVVTTDPSRQRLAGLLMRALVVNGDRVQAMEVYHQVREALEEFGMETSVALRRLALLAQRMDNTNSGLPRAPSRFTGRTEELATITSAALAVVEEDRPAVLWISGLPGIGKTALALQAAHSLRERFPDGQIFLPLNGFTPNMPPASLWDALSVLLTGLGVPPEQLPPTTEGRLTLYQSTLIGTRTLVVLDNAASEDQVHDLVPTAPGCLALVTSRRTGGIDTGTGIRLGPLTREHARTLFQDLVGGPRARHDRDLVEEVVARCGRMPLQIRVVASQFRLHERWPIEHLVRLLADAGTWRAETGVDDAATVACAVSYQQLSDVQRRLFRLFGQVIGTDLSVPAAAALAGCSVPQARVLLDELHRASLIEETSPERYLMLDPLKEYAARMLPPVDEHESPDATDRLLDFYLAAAAAAVRVAFPFDSDRHPTVSRTSPVAPEFPTIAAALEWLSSERGNLLAAVRHSAAHDRPEHSWQLAVLLWRWHYARGHMQDWLETLEMARRTLEAGGTERHGLAYVLLRLSGARWMSGEPDQALELAARALSLWSELADVQGQASALTAIALVNQDRDDNASAIAHFRAALERYEQVGDERGQAHALSNLGNLHELQGELDLSEQQHTAAAELLEKLGHSQGLAHALDNRGVTRQRLGHLDTAMADHERSRELAVEVGDRLCEAYALNNIATVHRRLGRIEEALLGHERARQVADIVGDPSLRIQLYLDRGGTYLAADEPEKARQTHFAALDLAVGRGDRGRAAHANHGAARALHLLGRHSEAAGHWQDAARAFADLRWTEAEELKAERAELTCACGRDPDD